MTTWWLKSCPKCGGDLYLDPVASEDGVKCLQCGLEVKLSFMYLDEKASRQPASEVKVAPPLRKRKRSANAQ